jgi:hypothetical protein
MRHLLPALSAAALLAGCGRPLLSAQIEVPEIRIVEPAQYFPMATAGGLQNLCDQLPPELQGNCLKVDVGYDLGAELPVFEEKGVTVDLRLTDVALRLTVDPQNPTSTGPADLSGVEAVRVLVQTAAGDWLSVASYTRPDDATAPSVTVSGRSNLDLSPFLSGGKLGFRVELTFDPSNAPPSFWADVEAGFSFVATVSYREAFL